MASHLLRWGAIFSVVVAVALAFSLRLQQPLTAGSEATYCYKRVRTQDPDLKTAQCFTVSDGVFTHVSSDDLKEEDDSVIVSDGYVIPGLWDGHGHLQQFGEFLHSVDLFGTNSLQEVRNRLKAYIASNPGAGSAKQWIRGVGWDQSAFGRMPTAADIEKDPELKGIYMMLDRIDVHCSWVSQSVLDLLPSDLPDVPGGEIIRDPGMGVFCDNALSVVMDLYPKPGPKAKAEAVKSAMQHLNSVGLVGMHNAGSPPSDLRLYKDLANSDDWSLRVYNMLECDVRNTVCLQDAIKVDRPDGRFTVRSVKLFADGALGSWGSAMLEPYTDHPWSSGSLLINGSALTTVTKAWAAAGYQVNIHAIGDLANRNAIDAFEAALHQQCPSSSSSSSSSSSLESCQADHRFRIEHAQIIHPDDQKRMHAIGIIPSIQPTHATSDMKYAEDRLGAERTASEAYRMKSFLPHISPILGSDFPVEPPNPFQGIYAAVTRKSPHTRLGPDGKDRGWHTDQALTIDEALHGFTVAPAHGAFLEGRAGLIKQGAFADWLVLDEPLEDIDVEKLPTLKVRETWVAGKRVYSRQDDD